MTENSASADVVVIGAGIVGLGIAWAAIRSGFTVRLVDPNPASGATYAAAGMLSPVSEHYYHQEEMLNLSLASYDLYPEFIDSLPPLNPPLDFQNSQTLMLGVDSADRQSLFNLYQLQQQHGFSVQQITIDQARTLEPMLSPQISSAFSVTNERHIDPRALVVHLEAGIAHHASKHGWSEYIFREKAVELLHAIPDDFYSAVTGVRLHSGKEIVASEVVVANGLGAPDLAGLPGHLSLPIRPVYGDILRLRVPSHLQPFLTAVVRGWVHGVPLYMVPRADGTVVLGATQREDDNAGVSIGGVYRLLRDAQLLLPVIAEMELVETTARARPGTPDNMPLLGRVNGDDGSDISGLIIATGFFRHGILLMPIATEICRRLLTGESAAEWNIFGPDRFSKIPVGVHDEQN
jgi:glycine oxidase